MAELIDAPATTVEVRSEADLIQVRHVLRAAAEVVGLGLVDQTKLVTAGSELTRNILTHAKGSQGTVVVEQVRSGEHAGVRATFEDNGPGIEDVESALTDGYSTVGGLGLGLPGSKRLVDELEITSAKNSPTTVVIVKWRRS